MTSDVMRSRCLKLPGSKPSTEVADTHSAEMPLKEAFFLAMWWLLLIVAPQGVEGIKPVVLVPGALASKIEAKLDKDYRSHFYCSKTSDWYLLWLKLESMLPPAVNCWADNFQMNYKNGAFSNIPGVTTRVKGFGTSHGLDYVDNWEKIAYFRDIVQGLLALPGAKVDITVRAAPYDFRYSPPSAETHEYFQRLRDLVEDTYGKTGNTKVVLLSHSLGGLITSSFLHSVSQDWKDTYIDCWVSLAGVFGGAVKEVKVMVSHGIIDLPDSISSRLLHRDLARKIMGNYFMLPRYPTWANDEVLLETPKRNYTVGNYDQLFNDMGVKDGFEKWTKVKDAAYTGDPEVTTYCFNGKDVPTSASFYYKEQSDFPDEIPEVKTGDGDGTVPARSLKICHEWRSTVQVTEYSGTDEGEHDRITTNPDFIKNLIKIVLS